MWIRRLTLGLLLFLFLPQPIASSKGAEEPTRDPDRAVRLVREAMSEGRPGLLSPLLPSGNKVHLSLRTIGPARGLYGGDQVIVHFERFFTRCPLVRYESTGTTGGTGGAPVNLHGRLTCRSPDGPVTLKLHFTLELTGAGWRLSEVWETG